MATTGIAAVLPELGAPPVFEHEHELSVAAPYIRRLGQLCVTGLHELPQIVGPDLDVVVHAARPARRAVELHVALRAGMDRVANAPSAGDAERGAAERSSPETGERAACDLSERDVEIHRRPRPEHRFPHE